MSDASYAGSADGLVRSERASAKKAWRKWRGALQEAGNVTRGRAWRRVTADEAVRAPIVSRVNTCFN